MKEKYSLFEIMKLINDGEEVLLPDIDNASEYITIGSVKEVRDYAQKFVKNFGQCFFSRNENRFEPINCYKFNQKR